MNLLFCSVGRRCELLKDFRKTLGDKVKLVVTDNSPYAPALESCKPRLHVMPVTLKFIVQGQILDQERSRSDQAHIAF